jgi:hypothetical protein
MRPPMSCYVAWRMDVLLRGGAAPALEVGFRLLVFRRAPVGQRRESPVTTRLDPRKSAHDLCANWPVGCAQRLAGPIRPHLA